MYYGIIYNNYGWSLLQSKGFDTPKEAEKVTKEILEWSNDQSPINVVHKMWLDCLQEWPSPQEQEEARIHCLNLKNQESLAQNQEDQEPEA